MEPLALTHGGSMRQTEVVDEQGTSSVCCFPRSRILHGRRDWGHGGGVREAQATTVTLSGWSSSPEENDLLTQVVATFNRTHPNIKVDYTIIQGDYPTAMTARFAAHNPPDVFYVDSSKFPEWARQGVLQPLNSYITKSKYNTAAFIPGLLNAFKSGKTIYGFPKDWSPLAMEINLSTPTTAGVKVPTTWAQLRSVAQQDGIVECGAER